MKVAGKCLNRVVMGLVILSICLTGTGVNMIAQAAPITNGEPNAQYKDYFFFNCSKDTLELEEESKEEFYLDEEGFDDLSLFRFKSSNTNVFTLGKITMAYCTVKAVGKGTAYLNTYYNGIFIDSVKIVVTSKQKEDDTIDNSGPDPGEGGSSFDDDEKSDNTNSNGNSDSYGSDDDDPYNAKENPTPAPDSGSSQKIATDVFKFNKTSVSVKKAGTKTIKCTLNRGKWDDITFSSSDKTIATVTKKTDKKIVIKGIKKGSATITAKHSSGNSYASKVKVTVTDSSASSNSNSKTKYAKTIKLSTTSTSVKKGKTITVKATAPSGTKFPSGYKVKWTSKDKKIAKVLSQSNKSAKIKGVTSGKSTEVTAKYTAKVNDKTVTKSVTCTIKVTK